MGSAIHINDKPWGVLTLDAMSAGAFDQMNPQATRTTIAAVAATIKVGQRIEALRCAPNTSTRLRQRLLANDLTPEIIGRSAAHRRCSPRSPRWRRPTCPC